MRFVVVVAAAAVLALAPIGCGGSSKDTAGASKQNSVNRTQVDGAYRVTTSAKELASISAPGESPENWGTWTLVLDRGRFAFTRENGQACTWAYGISPLERKSMDWTVVDGGGLQPKSVANEPGDRYRFKWSRFRDVLILSPVKGARAGYFAVKPWRRIAETPSAKYLSGRCPPPSAALQPTGVEGVTPPKGEDLGVGGNLTRTSPTRWEGNVTSRQLGRGRLTIEGNVVFRPPQTRSRLTFGARFSRGELRGCGIVDNYRRPHGRYVWDGPGQITGTSPALHTYLGLGMRFGGIIKIDALNRVHGGFGTIGPGGVC